MRGTFESKATHLIDFITILLFFIAGGVVVTMVSRPQTSIIACIGIIAALFGSDRLTHALCRGRFEADETCIRFSGFRKKCVINYADITDITVDTFLSRHQLHSAACVEITFFLANGKHYKFNDRSGTMLKDPYLSQLNAIQDNHRFVYLKDYIAEKGMVKVS